MNAFVVATEIVIQCLKDLFSSGYGKSSSFRNEYLLCDGGSRTVNRNRSGALNDTYTKHTWRDGKIERAGESGKKERGERNRMRMEERQMEKKMLVFCFVWSTYGKKICWESLRMRGGIKWAEQRWSLSTHKMFFFQNVQI